MTTASLTSAAPVVRASALAPLPEALAWVEAHTTVLDAETLDTATSLGRVLAEAVISPVDWPVADCAAIEGYAVRASDTEGAGEYSPIPLDAAPIAPGVALPSNMDAVLPLAAAEAVVDTLHVSAAVAVGANVARRGSEVRARHEAIPAGAVLRAQELALLALLGVGRVAVVRRPRVGLVVFGHAGPDALTPLLRALVAGDGGVAEALPGEYGADWARAGRFDLVMLAGRSGEGLGDDAPDALRHAGGTLDLHGVALRPGETAGLGRLGEVPVVLLPGMPLACLSAYAMLAAPALRRLSGRTAPAVREVPLTRRISSAVGFTELVRVRVRDNEAAPLAGPEGGGLIGAVQADGFVVMPDGSEGFDAGRIVTVHPYP